MQIPVQTSIPVQTLSKICKYKNFSWDPLMSVLSALACKLRWQNRKSFDPAWLPQQQLRIQGLVTKAPAYTRLGDRSSSYIFVTNPKRRIHVKSLDLGCRCRLWPNGGVCGLVCQKILQLPTSSGPLFSFYSIPVDFLKFFRSLHSLQ